MTATQTNHSAGSYPKPKGLQAMGFDFSTMPRRISTTNATRLRRIEWLTDKLDTAYALPGTKLRVGLDSIIGLLPVAGDTATALLSCYIVYEAKKMGLSRVTIARMLGNIAIDAGVGTIPLLGDFFDLAFKANVRNLKLIRDELGRTLLEVDATSASHKR